jgi:hypothetical protein
MSTSLFNGNMYFYLTKKFRRFSPLYFLSNISRKKFSFFFEKKNRILKVKEKAIARQRTDNGLII